MNAIVEIIKKALRAAIVWAERPTTQASRTESQYRAEKVVVYNTLLNQFWTWQLEVLKHLVVLNGLGLAASATIAAGSVFSTKLNVVGGWFWCFVAGLLMGAYGMFQGMQTLQKQRISQIRALDVEDGDHPEMEEVKVSMTMRGFMMLSLASFGAGAAAIVYSLR